MGAEQLANRSTSTTKSTMTGTVDKKKAGEFAHSVIATLAGSIKTDSVRRGIEVHANACLLASPYEGQTLSFSFPSDCKRNMEGLLVLAQSVGGDNMKVIIAHYCESTELLNGITWLKHNHESRKQDIDRYLAYELYLSLQSREHQKALPQF